MRADTGTGGRTSKSVPAPAEHANIAAARQMWKSTLTVGWTSKSVPHLPKMLPTTQAPRRMWKSTLTVGWTSKSVPHLPKMLPTTQAPRRTGGFGNPPYGQSAARGSPASATWQPTRRRLTRG
jgi:hypothetical protein